MQFPVSVDILVANYRTQLSRFNENLMNDLKHNSRERVYVYKTSGTVVYDEFYPKYSKPIIDEIDRVIARHYSFTDKELDFIINYDIKYRMGRDALENDESS